MVDVTASRAEPVESEGENELTRDDRRKRYQQVLSTVAHNTTERQPPGIRPTHVRLHQVAHGRWSVDGVNSSVRAAINNDDLLRWRDQEGNVRLTLRAEPDLKRLAQHVGAVIQDPKQLARINQALLEVRADE